MKKNIGSYSLLNLISISIVVIWVSTILGSLFWNLHLDQHQTKAVATHVAKAYFDKDLAFRLWGAKHGGVYAPVSKTSPPNPYLSHVTERDLKTPSGKQLTLINPAYMLRQMMQEFSKLTGVGGHLTSLKLLNPINKPDAWEEKNLRAFADGAEEVTSFMEMDGKLTLRMMRPFITQKNCLKCHAHQGYKVGDVRGATTISIPMEPYLAIENELRKRMVFTHLFMLMLGLLGVGLGDWRIRKNINQHITLKEELKGQNEFTYNIIESLSHPFIVFDVNSHVIEMANSAALGDATLVGQTCYSLSHNRKEPCGGDKHPCPITVLKATKKTVTVEHVHYDAKGKERNVEIHCYPLFDENGEVSKIVEYAIDITDRRTAEVEKQNLQNQLLQAQKMEAIGTLAGGIAHDFNNILNAIIGYSDLVLLETPQKSKQFRQIMQIRNAGDRATELVQQILAFGRRSAQERQPLQLQFVTKEVLKLLRSTLPSTIEMRQDINTNCSSVLADNTQIHQVIMNLCTNAFHAMQDQKGTLEVRLEEVQVDQKLSSEVDGLLIGKHIQLTVMDTGKGMDRNTLEHIFEPYFTTKQKGEGTGLGLATVHGIVKSHGGVISVTSGVGKGTTFTLLFPVVDKNVDLIFQKEELNELPNINARILFIDDVDINVELGINICEHLGCDVTGYTDSLKALDLFRQDPGRFDIVITDQTMPKLTGFELAQKLLNINPSISIIMVTGHSDTVDINKAKEIGIKDFLKKPLDIGVLANSISKALSDG